MIKFKGMIGLDVAGVYFETPIIEVTNEQDIENLMKHKGLGKYYHAIGDDNLEQQQTTILPAETAENKLVGAPIDTYDTMSRSALIELAKNRGWGGGTATSNKLIIKWFREQDDEQRESE